MIQGSCYACSDPIDTRAKPDRDYINIDQCGRCRYNGGLFIKRYLTMSASHSELKDKLTEDQILAIIRSGCRDYLIFEITSNPPVDADQWFIRKSSAHGHVT